MCPCLLFIKGAKIQFEVSTQKIYPKIWPNRAKRGHEFGKKTVGLVFYLVFYPKPVIFYNYKTPWSAKL
jgi:hypothetical protein